MVYSNSVHNFLNYGGDSLLYFFFLGGGAKLYATPFPIVCDPTKKRYNSKYVAFSKRTDVVFYVLLTVYLSIILAIDQLNAQILVL